MINVEKKYVIGCSSLDSYLVFCLYENHEIKLISTNVVDHENFQFFFKKKLIDFLEYIKIDFSQIENFVIANKTFGKFLTCLQDYSLQFPCSFKFFLNNFPKQILKNIYLKEFVETSVYQYYWQKNKPIKKGYIIEEFNKKILFTKTDFALIAGIYGVSKENDLAIFYLNKEYQENSVVLASVVGNQNKIYKEINFPNSLHYLKESFNYYFGENYQDFKIGKNNQQFNEKICQTLVNDLIFIGEDGSFLLNFQYLKLADKKYSFTKKFKKFLKQKIFLKNQPDCNEINIFMASLDEVFKRIIIKMLKNLQKISSLNNLVVLGCDIINQEMLEYIRNQNIFKEVHFQPYFREVLKAIGCSLIYNYQQDKKINKVDISKTINLNCPNSFNSNQIKDKLENMQAKYLSVFDDEFANIIFENLRNNKIILWFNYNEISDYSLGNKGLIACLNQKNIERLKLLEIKNNSLILLKNNLLNFYSADKEINFKKVTDNQDQLRELFKFEISPNNLFHRVLQKYHIEDRSCFLINSTVESLSHFSNHKNYDQIADYYHFFNNNDIDVLVVENFILFKEDQF